MVLNKSKVRIKQHERGLLFKHGDFQGVLAPGAHRSGPADQQGTGERGDRLHAQGPVSSTPSWTCSWRTRACPRR